MSYPGATRSLAVGVALAVLALTTLGGLSRAAVPAPGARPGQETATSEAATATAAVSATVAGPTLSATAGPTATVTAAPSATPTTVLTPTATATLTPTPEPTATARPPGPICRLVGTAFAADGAVPGLFWSRVQNTGPSTVTLQALQVGWAGEQQALMAVTARRDGAGGTDIALFGGQSKSPALVTLAGTDGGPRLGPGQALSLGLRFAPLPGMPAGAPTLGPAVLFTEEGCLAALASAPPAAGCGLAAGPPRLSETEPGALAVRFANQGATALDLATLELRWPVADNGRLLALGVGGGPRLPLAERPGVSPAVIGLERVLGAPLRLEPGAAVELSLWFEHPAAPPPAPYTLVAASRQGCVASATTWLAATDCGVGAQGFQTRGRTAVLRLANRRAVTQTLSALSVFWPRATNGPLVAVALDGRPVWTGEAPVAPAAIVLPEAAALGPDRGVELQLTFRPPEGADGAATAIASGDYSLVAWLRGGCQLLFSTATGQTMRCSVSAGEWQVTDTQQASVGLTNAGAEASLRRLDLSWPRKNGNLVGVWLGGSALFTGVREPGTAPFSLTFEPGRQVLPRNESRTLRLAFAGRAARGGYSAALQFDDASGTACGHILVTSGPVQAECRLSLADFRIVANEAEIVVDNAGQDDLEVSSLTADWPNDQRLINLVQVALLGGGGANPIWTGYQSAVPATLRPNTGSLALLERRARAILRLRFNHVLDMPDPAGSFAVTLSTAEGCLAGYAPGGGAAQDALKTFRARINALPVITGIFGQWQVDVDGGTRRTLAVDQNTDFVPLNPSPRVGDAVQVMALVDGEDRYYAREITFIEAETALTLEGAIEALDGREPPAWLTVTGQQVVIGDDTLVEGQLELGAKVTVKARQRAGGPIEALLVKVNKAPAGEPVLFTGAVQAARVEASDQVWEVDQFLVRVLPGTTVDPPLEPPGSLPAVGKRVDVRGRLDGEVVTAASIQIHPDPVVLESVGVIEELPAAGLLGAWRVRVPEGPLTFTVGSPSVLDTRAGPAERGMLARLRLQLLADGRLVALRVRIDWPD